MNILLLILLIVLGLIALLLILASFQGSEYRISNSIVIRKPAAEVYSYVKLLRNMDHYNKWVMTDPAMKKTFSGTDGTVGFVYAWDSQDKNAGKGEQEIRALVPDQRVETEIRFERPFSGVSYSDLLTEALPDGSTRVSSVFRGTKSYGMKVAHLLLGLEKALGKDQQITLGRLKALMEQ